MSDGAAFALVMSEEMMKRLKLEQDKIDGAAKAAQEIVNFLSNRTA
jgi:hypothetical protein